MNNRRLLPIMALIVSAIIFVGALVFALRPSDTPRAVAPPAATVPGTIVAAGQGGAATLTPPPTAEPSAEPSAEPTAEPTRAPAPSARASAAIASATRAVPTAVAPVAAGPTPTGGSAGALPPGITPAAPPPASQPPASQPPASQPPASQPSAPPVAAAPPTPTPVPPTAAPPAPQQPAQPAAPTATKPPAAAPPPVTSGPPPANVGVPVRVIIPSLGVDAVVEQVGVDGDGNMATPADPWNTGWYSPGARPGARGNAAIAGHVDYHGIGPVVFWDLNKLAVGAEVLVVTDSGQTLRFRVRGGEYYQPANAPLQEIFGQTNNVNLNLITCGGTFNPATREYDQRYVVFTTYAGQ